VGLETAVVDSSAKQSTIGDFVPWDC